MGLFGGHIAVFKGKKSVIGPAVTKEDFDTKALGNGFVRSLEVRNIRNE
jgi:hypothetical protein